MAHSFRLPDSLIGSADVARVKRSLETLNDQHQEARLRAKKGGNEVTIDEPSRGLVAVAESNDYNLDTAEDRTELLSELEKLIATAPTITMSFAVDPSAAFMTKIVGWLRTNIDPCLMVRVGLQPSIAAGCIVRTSGKIYDFSLRSKFTEQRPMLIARLKQTKQQSMPDVTAVTVEATS